jgi:cyclase
MQAKKLVACFDVIDGHVTKARKFQDNIEVGEACEVAKAICAEQIDEIILFDVTASNEKRPIDIDMVKRVAAHISVPLTVGGGIRTIDDMREALKAGADKISIDSMAVRNPDIISESAKEFGSRCIVLSMQVQRVPRSETIPSGYEVAIDGARVFTGKDAVAWAKTGEALGAGEICVNSIDNDGMHNGYDIEITSMIADAVNLPVIASGGAGLPEHLKEVFTKTKACAGIISSMLYSPRLERHYTVKELKEYLAGEGVQVLNAKL